MALGFTWLVREWRHFLPSILAVAFSCLLLVVQAALVLGIFGSAAVYIEASEADLWVGQPDTQSVNFGQPVDADIDSYLRMDANVAQVEPYVWVEGNWRTNEGAGAAIAVFVSGVSPHADALMFGRLLTPPMRAMLRQPGAIIIDRADMDSLGVKVGDQAWINGIQVFVAAATSGLRALGGINVLASLATAHDVQPGVSEAWKPTYWVARLVDPAAADATRDRLPWVSAYAPFEVWTAAEFSRRSQHYWLLDTGAGVAVLFMAVIVMLVGAVVTGQALVSIVTRAEKEYAVLMALGVDRWALARVVLVQSALIGCVGILIGGSGSAALLVLAHASDVPVAMSSAVAFGCAGLVMLLALVSGAGAMRGVLRTNPVSLLR